MADEEWSIYVVDEVREWIYGLDKTARDRVAQAIDVLAERGPRLGRPLVDTIQHSSLANLKELRPGDARLLFVFDPWRSAIFLSPATSPDGGESGTSRRSRWPKSDIRST